MITILNRAIVAFFLMGSILCTGSVALAADHSGSSPDFSIQSRVELQAALRRYIDRRSVRGAFPVLDLKEGKLIDLFPTASHPMIIRLGDLFVLCSDFRDEAGNSVDVDFYVSKTGRGYSFIQVETDHHEPLISLMNAGLAKLVE